MEVSRELLEYLNSVEDLYKTGIPLSMLGGGSSQVAQSMLVSWGQPTAKINFIGLDCDWRLDPAGQPFAGSNGELFLSLLEKGLKLDIQQARVVALFYNLPTVSPAQLRSLAEKIRIELTRGLVVVLGEKVWTSVLGRPEVFSEVRGKIVRHAELQLLPTYALSQVRTDLALKREFWSDLQVLIDSL